MTIYQFFPTLDTYIDASNPTTNFGAGAGLRIGTKGKGTGLYRILIQVDISAIPAGSKFTAAQFQFHVRDGGSTGVGTDCGLVRFDRLVQTAWTASGATWNTYDGTNNWGGAGCGNTTTDYSTTNEFLTSTAPVLSEGWWKAETNANFVAMVQDALDNQSGILRCRMQEGTETLANIEWSELSSADEGGSADRLPTLFVHTAGGKLVEAVQAVNRGSTY